MSPRSSMQTSRLTSTLRRGQLPGAGGQAGADDGRQQLRRDADGDGQARTAATRCSGRCSSRLVTRISAVSTTATCSSSTENRRSPTWKSVSGCALAEAERRSGRTRPAPPVATTTPVPRPGLDDGAHERAAASGRPARRRRAPAGSLSTGSDSPVRTLSSHCRPGGRRAAAGRPARPRPSASRTTSPGTSAVTSTCAGGPSRSDDGGVPRPVECSASAARSARYSLTKPRPTLTSQDHADDDRVGAVAQEEGDDAR